MREIRCDRIRVRFLDPISLARDPRAEKKTFRDCMQNIDFARSRILAILADSPARARSRSASPFAVSLGRELGHDPVGERANGLRLDLTREHARMREVARDSGQNNNCRNSPWIARKFVVNTCTIV